MLLQIKGVLKSFAALLWGFDFLLLAFQLYISTKFRFTSNVCAQKTFGFHQAIRDHLLGLVLFPPNHQQF